MEAAIKAPWCIGAHWFQYLDQPYTGRSSDGENYNIGFVSITDTPESNIVNAARDVSREMYPLRLKKEYIKNSGFEAGSMTSWKNTGGSAAVSETNVLSGKYSAYISGLSGGIEQKIEGLKPNTVYTLTGNVKTTNGSVSLGVKNYGGDQIAVSISTGSYVKNSINFKTGASDTSAVVFIWHAFLSSCYADDFSLEMRDSALSNVRLTVGGVEQISPVSGSAVIKADVTNLMSTAKTPTFAIVYYNNDGKVEACSIENQRILPKYATELFEKGIDLPPDAHLGTIKIFLWDSEFVPLSGYYDY